MVIAFKKFSKIIVSISIVFVVASTVHAKPVKGPGDIGSGGDPDAQEFISLGKKLSLFFKENPLRQKLPFDVKKFESTILEIEKSIKDESIPDQIEFTDEKLLDKDGIEKSALFFPNKPLIRVSRINWKTFSLEDHLTLVIMEVTGLLRTPERYENARSMVRDHGALIDSIPIPGEMGQNLGGMKMISRDHQVFGRISKEDILVDAGEVGQRSQVSQRVDRFLSNPSEDPEWYSLMKKAWSLKRPFFFMLSGPHGNSASITAFWEVTFSKENRLSESGLGTYTLVLSAKSGERTSVCEEQSSKIDAHQKLKNCLLNPKFYSDIELDQSQSFNTKGTILSTPSALEILGKKLKSQLLLAFANQDMTLAMAFRENYVSNFAALRLAGFSNYLEGKLLRASGFEPSFTSETDDVPMWTRTKNIDPSSLRLKRAFELLEKEKLGFLGTGFECSSNNQPEVLGPKILPLQQLRKFRLSRDCRGWVVSHADFEADLYQSLVEAGFNYDFKLQKWTSRTNDESPKDELQK